MSKRDEHIEKLNKAKEELKRSTGWHKRDMYKYVKRLEGELRMYNYYQNKAKA